MDDRLNQVIDRLEALAAISDNSEFISRYYGTEAHDRAAEQLIAWMEEAGMSTRKDAIGNVRGILKSSAPNAKKFIIGSHYDSVANAGKYDGPLGIILGIAMVEKLVKEKAKMPFDLEVIAFADEEGCRFGTAYLGSSVIVNTFQREWLDRPDDDGKKVQEVVMDHGHNPDDLFTDHYQSDDVLGYYEIHIEQGPVLDSAELPCACVRGIAAQTRVQIEWTGKAGHAGTTPMNRRQDALCAAAEFVLAANKVGAANAERLVATVGQMKVSPNSSNVIPGHVMHTLDIRSIDSQFLHEQAEALSTTAGQIATKMNVQLNWNLMQSNDAVPCDEGLIAALEEAIKEQGNGYIPALVSGAGHDAVMMANSMPVVMLFVRCREGLSHHPDEYARPEDIEAALKVSDAFISKLSEKKN